MSKYKCLIFDVDNTILQYDASAAKALQTLLLNHGIEYTHKIEGIFRQICYDLWKSFDLNLLDNPVIRENYHELFKEYNYKRFEVFLNVIETFNLNDRNAYQLSQEYIDIFNNTHIFEEHAIDVLKKCSKTHLIAAATNGLANIQYKRLNPVKQYITHFFISEEMGYVKPMKEFYDYMLCKMRLSSKQCLFIGDLYTTDIVGAINADMDAIWYKTKESESAKWLEASLDYNIAVPVIDSLNNIYQYL
ncbi:MAG TPA: HAD-IA family hydrolase [Clostridia bacterium]|nr:MAG: putative HAD-hydrolase YfnB [Firmicutes bacterium ADurb.Bin146]HOD92322.1 HAD-IA family hydrolase [Clostridia bacterium]HQM38681.1 HAD-IA family hydrolase [Clostridia bacterium]